MQPIASIPGSTHEVLSPAVHQKLVNKVRATILNQLLALVKSQFAHQLFSEAIVVWLAWDHADKRHLLVWFILFVCIHHPIELWGYFHTKRHAIADDKVKNWTYFVQLIYCANSIFWGYAYFSFALGSKQEPIFFILTVGIMIFVANYSRSDIRTAYGMVTPIGIGMIAAHLLRGTEQDYILAIFTLAAFLALMHMVSAQSKQIFDGLYTRFLNEELADALKAKNEEIMRAKQEVEIASQAKSRFFAAASHDLRQPLHALSLLMGSLQLNIERQKNVRPTLEKIGVALGSLESLFEDVLNIAKLESGKTNVETRTISPQTLFNKLEYEFEPLAASKNLKLRFRARPLQLETDGILLERILRNLISNAIKYTDKGGVLIACRALKREGVAKIQVLDTGIGIPETHLPYIFEDFYQVPTTAGERREGVGLGLGIVKRLADRLNYPIHVRSQLNRGSNFTLSVPLSMRQEGNAITAAEPIRISDFSLAGRTILVVDDDQLVVDAIKSLLSDWNAEVMTAISSAELEHILEELATPPDFVITDFQFEPAFTGENVVQRVRERLGAIVPSALMTGNISLVPERVSLMERVHVFSKPVNPAKLRALLHFNLISSQTN